MIDSSLSLKVPLFNKVLKNPLLLGSGTLIEEFDQIQAFLDSGIAGVIPRTTRKTLERKTHPVPHLYQSGSRNFPIMLNAEWTGADIAYWRPYLERMSNTHQIIMSISGRDIEGCVEVCSELDLFENWLYFEINLSCAHSNNVHGMITRNKEHIKKITYELKNADIKTPIAIKLGYSDHILELANTVKEAGADAIVAINTYGPVFDFSIDSSGNPQHIVGIEGGKGGLSGSSIFQIALTAVAEIKKHIGIPVIGCGGVVSAEDVIKMLMAGASAVQIYSAAHVKGIRANDYFKKLQLKIKKFMLTNNIHKLDEIIGKALPILDQKTTLKVQVPEINTNSCIGCDLCIPVCLPSAISAVPAPASNKTGHIIKIEVEKCVGCGHCIHVCPTQPNTLTLPTDK